MNRHLSEKVEEEEKKRKRQDTIIIANPYSRRTSALVPLEDKINLNRMEIIIMTIFISYLFRDRSIS